MMSKENAKEVQRILKEVGLEDKDIPTIEYLMSCEVRADEIIFD